MLMQKALHIRANTEPLIRMRGCDEVADDVLVAFCIVEGILVKVAAEELAQVRVLLEVHWGGPVQTVPVTSEARYGRCAGQRSRVAHRT
jgi:hypothetical protein